MIIYLCKHCASAGKYTDDDHAGISVGGLCDHCRGKQQERREFLLPGYNEKKQPAETTPTPQRGR